MYVPRINTIDIDKLVIDFQKLNVLFEMENNLELKNENNKSNLNNNYSTKLSKLVFKKTAKVKGKKTKLIMLSGINKKTLKNKSKK